MMGGTGKDPLSGDFGLGRMRLSIARALEHASRLWSAAEDRLIDDWRRGWRFWSVRLQAMALASGTALIAAPDLLARGWAAIPVDMRALLPGDLARWLPLIFGLLALLARFLKQRREPHHGR